MKLKIFTEKIKYVYLLNKVVDNPHFWILYSTFFHMSTNSTFLQGVSGSCSPVLATIGMSVRLSVRPSVRPSVRHTLTLCENDAS